MLAAIVPPSARLATSRVSVPVSTAKSASAVAMITSCWYSMSRLLSLMPMTAGCPASQPTTAGLSRTLVNTGMLYSTSGSPAMSGRAVSSRTRRASATRCARPSIAPSPVDPAVLTPLAPATRSTSRSSASRSMPASGCYGVASATIAPLSSTAT
jgi:hypothetical protein